MSTQLVSPKVRSSPRWIANSSTSSSSTSLTFEDPGVSTWIRLQCEQIRGVMGTSVQRPGLLAAQRDWAMGELFGLEHQIFPKMGINLKRIEARRLNGELFHLNFCTISQNNYFFEPLFLFDMTNAKALTGKRSKSCSEQKCDKQPSQEQGDPDCSNPRVSYIFDLMLETWAPDQVHVLSTAPTASRVRCHDDSNCPKTRRPLDLSLVLIDFPTF